MDGLDEGQTFDDASASNHTITANGNAKTEDTQKKFGATSLYLDGTGDFLSVPDSSDWEFGTGDFTMDCWFYSLGTQPIHAGIMGQNNSTNTYQNMMQVADGNTLRWQCHAGIEIVAGVFSNNTWHHVAFVRNGDTATIYLDGFSVGTGTFTTTIGNIDSVFWIGNRNYGSGDGVFYGYIDEARVSKGVARWTSNFTPDTQAYGGGFSVTVNSGIITNVE